MRGLTILVAGESGDRLDAALTLAAAAAAAGARTRLYLHGCAVRCVVAPGALFAVALDLGVEAIVCQTGLAEAGLSADLLDARIAAGGMVSLVATLGEDRLVAF